MDLKKLFNNSFLKASVLSTLAFSSIDSALGQEVVSLLAVNSPYDEQHPVISPKGDLFFTVAFYNGNQDPGDVWYSVLSTEGSFEKPIRIPELSTSGYDVVVGFMDPQNILIYHDGREKRQGIYQYTLTNNSWNYTQQLEIASFKNFSDHFSARLSSSGDVLILSMESYGSYGNEDIYVSFLKETGKWSAPQNLGSAINTYQQEMTPYLSEDKQLLFFSTNGHGTASGRDIYFAQRLDESWENWSVPRPLAYGNTDGAELAYLPMSGENNLAIFTSTQNSEGYGDLRIIQTETIIPEHDEEKNDELTVLKFEPAAKEELPVPTATETVALDKNNAEAEQISTTSESGANLPPEFATTGSAQADEQITGAEVPEVRGFSLKVLDKNSLKEIDYSISVTDRNGTSLHFKNSEYENEFPVDRRSLQELLVMSPGYLPMTIKTPSIARLSEPVLLTPALKGASMALQEVLFKRGTAELSEGNYATFIDGLARFLKENKEIRIVLEGHTDNLGNPQLNKELSLDRASAIRKLIVDQGVDFERIRIAGWGGSKPIANNQTEEGRTKNRRVEMIIQ